MKGDDAAWLAAHIQAVEEKSARCLLRQGWDAHSDSYNVGVFHGDVDALEKRMGRPLTPEEARDLEAAIRSDLRTRSGGRG